MRGALADLIAAQEAWLSLAATCTEVPAGGIGPPQDRQRPLAYAQTSPERISAADEQGRQIAFLWQRIDGRA